MAQGPNSNNFDSRNACVSQLWQQSNGSVVSLKMRPPGTPFTTLDTFMAAHSPRRFCQARQKFILKPLAIEKKISDAGFSSVCDQNSIRLGSRKLKNEASEKVAEDIPRLVSSPLTSTSGGESSGSDEIESITQRVLALGKCKLSTGEDFIFPCDSNSNQLKNSNYFRPGPRVTFPQSRTCSFPGSASGSSTSDLIAIGTIPVTSQRQAVQKPMSRWKAKATLNLKGSKYPDPMMGAGPGLQGRITEMAQLEVETIRYEKTKRTKKKSSSS